MAASRYFVEFDADQSHSPFSEDQATLQNNDVASILHIYSRSAQRESFLGARAAPNVPLFLSSRDLRAHRAIAAVSLDEMAVEEMLLNPRVKAIWDDPPIEPAPLNPAFSNFDLSASIGTKDDVIEALGCRSLWESGSKGQKVAIAICDTGVDEGIFPVIDGWAPKDAERWGVQAKTPFGWHGSMAAHGALIAAPEAVILDVGVLKFSNRDRGAWLSDAIVGINWVASWASAHPEYRVVINNSWSTYRRLASDTAANVGSYANSREHPFNERIEVLVGEGIPIVFAAGNCGNPCPDLRCGDNDKGPDKSVWGAASLASVLSIAAVSVAGERLPYSSQGRGQIDEAKPDFACYSQFKGFLPTADPGTSTASCVMSGYVALLLSALPNVTADQLHAILRKSCGTDSSWTTHTGYGTPGQITPDDLKQYHLVG